MGRKASVKYWNSRKAYCCEVKGEQHTLAVGPKDEPDGACYQAAKVALEKLLNGKVSDGPVLSEVVGKYLDTLKHNAEPATVRIRRQRLAAVCGGLGDESVSSLTSYQVEEFCNRQRALKGWKDGTVRMTLTSVKACLRWAKEKGVIPAYPLGKVSMPATTSRGVECVLTDDQVVTVLMAAKSSLRDYVQMLSWTGARPSEIARAEAKHYDRALGAIVLQKHKTSKKTKKARVIYLHSQAREMVEKLCERHPTGPLFRTSRPKVKGQHKGERWGFSGDDVVNAFRHLRKKTGIRGLVAYSMRHTYAVKKLTIHHVPSIALAELMGTSVQMLIDHYGHAASQHDYLRSFIDD